MGKAPAKSEHNNVARLRLRIVGDIGDLTGIAHHALKIPLAVAMQVPIRRVKRHLDMRDDTSPRIDLGEQCQTIGPNAFDPRHVMVGSAQPLPGFLDDRKSPGISRDLGDYGSATRIGQTAVSGVGIYGKPPKCSPLLKTLVQVAIVRSQPGSNWN